MPSISSQLAKDYPHLSFKPADDFHWSPKDKSVYFNRQQPNSPLLIHELSHAVLGHDAYDSDVGLLKMERQAWLKATEIAPQYGIDVSEDTIESHLDTYREWLHARSTCPTCDANGFQIKKLLYRCPACLSEWKVNEARLCGLKRHTTKTPL